MSSWMTTNKLNHNINKTYYMMSGNRTSQPNIMNNGSPITRHIEGKFLGLYFDCNFKFNTYMIQHRQEGLQNRRHPLSDTLLCTSNNTTYTLLLSNLPITYLWYLCLGIYYSKLPKANNTPTIYECSLKKVLDNICKFKFTQHTKYSLLLLCTVEPRFFVINQFEKVWRKPNRTETEAIFPVRNNVNPINSFQTHKNIEKNNFLKVS